MTVKWVTIEGTTWPIDDDSTDDSTTQWRLRYNNGQVSRESMLSAASVMQAYASLVDPTITQGDAIAKLKRARAAAAFLSGQQQMEAAYRQGVIDGKTEAYDEGYKVGYDHGYSQGGTDAAVISAELRLAFDVREIIAAYFNSPTRFSGINLNLEQARIAANEIVRALASELALKENGQTVWWCNSTLAPRCREDRPDPMGLGGHESCQRVFIVPEASLHIHREGT